MLNEIYCYMAKLLEILKQAHMVSCNPSRTLVDTESKLGDDGDPVSDPTLYHSLVGALQHLTFTRPNISYAMQQICIYMHDSQEPHFLALKLILRYVRGTLDHGLQLYSSSNTSLVAYSNADSSSKRQSTLSWSSVEAEYYGVANAVVETCWLWNLLRELHTLLPSATVVYFDNVSGVYLSFNLIQHQRTKHIEIGIHIVRDLIVLVRPDSTCSNPRYHYSCIFTKVLLSALFESYNNLSVRVLRSNCEGVLST
ncbi:ribonuclease H-like domain-containing protein [Tanacetum coccineum]|uniref:Ribonuclease H-like domain-containing protein n=1 Tax=Tanacetum coccineum TaxID=301880 RepID=A0ABQ5I5L3_9ASTR